MSDQPAIITFNMPAQHKSIATVSVNGTVVIDWEEIEKQAVDPKAPNRHWAKLLLCARDNAKCGPYE